MTMNTEIQASSTTTFQPASAANDLPPDAILGDHAVLIDRKPGGILIIINVPDHNLGLSVIRDLLCRDTLEAGDVRTQPVERTAEIEAKRARQIEKMRQQFDLPADHRFNGIKCFVNKGFPKGVPAVDMTPILKKLEPRGYFLDEAYALCRATDGKTSVRFSFKECGGSPYSLEQLKRIWNYLTITVPYLHPHDNGYVPDEEGGTTLCLDGTHQFVTNKAPKYEIDFVGDTYQFAIVPKADRRNR